jgi:hypothetical protein
MHLTLPLLHPPLQARGGGEPPHGEAGISMQVPWGRPPFRVVPVVGRPGGGVLYGLGSLGSSCTRGSVGSTRLRPTRLVSAKHGTERSGMEREARLTGCQLARRAARAGCAAHALCHMLAGRTMVGSNEYIGPCLL